MAATPAAAQTGVTDPNQPAADQYATPNVASSGGPTAAGSTQALPAVTATQAPSSPAGELESGAQGAGPDEVAGVGPDEGGGAAPVEVARRGDARPVDGLPFTGGWPLLIALMGLLLLLLGSAIEVARRARDRRRASVTG